jgi:hypothetical protein
MKTAIAKKITMAAASLVLALAGSAAAVTVNYTVGGTGPLHFPAATPPPAGAPWGENGYPGDTVELEGYTGTLDLIPGTYVLKINTLHWTIDYTYGGTASCWDYPDCWSELAFPVSAPRSITVHTANGTLAQAGLLECNWDNDYVALNTGSTVSFSISGVMVYVTPLPVARVGAFFGMASYASTTAPQSTLCDIPCVQPGLDVWAQFVVEGTVPVEPGTWARVKGLYR